MKETKTLIERIKGMEKQTKNKILTVFVVLIAVVVFIAGYKFADIYMYQPTSESDFKRYEQVARDIYEQGDVLIYDIPGDVKAEITNTKIVISSATVTKDATLTANLQNGELVFTRNLQKGEEVIGSLAMGVLFIVVLAVILLIASVVYEWSKELYATWKKKHK